MSTYRRPSLLCITFSQLVLSCASPFCLNDFETLGVLSLDIRRTSDGFHRRAAPASVRIATRVEIPPCDSWTLLSIHGNKIRKLGIATTYYRQHQQRLQSARPIRIHFQNAAKRKCKMIYLPTTNAILCSQTVYNVWTSNLTLSQ